MISSFALNKSLCFIKTDFPRIKTCVVALGLVRQIPRFPPYHMVVVVVVWIVMIKCCPIFSACYEAMIGNLHINSFCPLSDINSFYWTSLSFPVPPVSDDNSYFTFFCFKRSLTNLQSFSVWLVCIIQQPEKMHFMMEQSIILSLSTYNFMLLSHLVVKPSFFVVVKIYSFRPHQPFVRMRKLSSAWKKPALIR